MRTLDSPSHQTDTAITTMDRVRSSTVDDPAPRIVEPGSRRTDADVPPDQTDEVGPTTPRWRPSWHMAAGLVIPAVVLGTWELVCAVHAVPTALLPPPSAVVGALREWAGIGPVRDSLFFRGTLATDVGATLLRVAIGFLLASAVGVSLGTAMGVSRITEAIWNPALRIIGPVPPITFIPVVIVILGIGDRAVLFLTFLGAVVPITAATATAVSGVGRDLVRCGRMMGRRGLRLVVGIVLPAAFPNIVGGMRLGLGLSWMMAVTAEMLAVHSGLGYMLWNSYNYLVYPGVFAGMLMIGLCGLSTDLLLRLVTRRHLRWHRDIGVRS
jgi:NitT/TauT family transport system permease protein